MLVGDGGDDKTYTPGKSGPYVAALDIIKAATKTNESNATQRMDKLKIDYPETFTGSKHFQFPQRKVRKETQASYDQ